MTKNSKLVDESQAKRKRYLRWSLVIIVFLGLAAYAWYQQSQEPEDVAEVETYTVERTDIRSLVDSEGSIINPDIANLSFLINGTLGELYVEEGQKVQAGDVLAKLDTTDLRFDLRDAQNGVNIAFANLEAKKADVTDTEFLNASQDYDRAQESYEAEQKSAEQTVQQAYEDVKVVIDGVFPEIETSLQTIDAYLGEEPYHSGSIMVYTAFNDTVRESETRTQYNQVRRGLQTLTTKYYAERNTMAEEKLKPYIKETRNLVQLSQGLINNMDVLLRTARPTSFISQDTLYAGSSDMQSVYAQVVAELNNLTNADQVLDAAKLTRRNTLISAQRDLEASLIKLQNSEKNQAKLQTSKSTGLNIQQAQLAQSRLRVDKANYNLSLATLKSPINGVVVEVNGSVGETIKVETANSDNAFIKVLSDSNFTTEVYVEEGDIAKVALEQKVEITLEAIDDVVLEGVVGFISSTATRDSNGIITYLVRIDITDDKGAAIREGMTTEVNFIMGEALDVLAILNEAIVDDKFVNLESGERVEIETGFTDGALTEVLSGLEEGQVIVIGDGGANPQPSKSGDADLETRMKAVGERLEASGTKPDNWDRMSPKEQQAYLQELRNENGAFGGRR